MPTNVVKDHLRRDGVGWTARDDMGIFERKVAGFIRDTIGEEVLNILSSLGYEAYRYNKC